MKFLLPTLFFLMPMMSLADNANMWLDNVYISSTSHVDYLYYGPADDIDTQRQLCMDQLRQKTQNYEDSYLYSIVLNRYYCSIGYLEIDEISPESLRVAAGKDFDFSKQDDLAYVNGYFSSEIRAYLSQIKASYPFVDFELSAVDSVETTPEGKFLMDLDFKALDKVSAKTIQIESFLKVKNEGPHRPVADELELALAKIEFLKDALRFFYPVNFSVQTPPTVMADCPTEDDFTCVYFRYELQH